MLTVTPEIETVKDVDYSDRACRFCLDFTVPCPGSCLNILAHPDFTLNPDPPKSITTRGG